MNGTCARRIKTSLVLLTVLLSTTGCQLLEEKRGKDFAHFVMDKFNTEQYLEVWPYLDPTSQEAVAVQLEQARGTRMGRMMLSRVLKVPTEQIDTLTPPSYFDLVMRADPLSGQVDTQIISIEIDGDGGQVFWQRQDRTGISYLFNRDGYWRIALDNLEGQG